MGGKTDDGAGAAVSGVGRAVEMTSPRVIKGRRTSKAGQGQSERDSPTHSPTASRQRRGKEARGAHVPEHVSRTNPPEPTAHRSAEDKAVFDEYTLTKAQKKTVAGVDPPLIDRQPRGSPEKIGHLRPIGPALPAPDPYKRNRTGGNRTTSDAEFLGKSTGLRDLETATLTQSSNQGTMVRHGDRDTGLHGDEPLSLGLNSSVGVTGMRVTAREGSKADVLLRAEYGQSATISRHASPTKNRTGVTAANTSSLRETGLLTQQLNSISNVPITRIPDRPQLHTKVPNRRTELAVDPTGEARARATPHGVKTWDPNHPSTAPFVAGYNQGHDAALLDRGGNGAVLPNEPDIDYGAETPRYCCFKDSIDPRPLSDERARLAELGPFHLWNLTPAWRVPLCSCEDASCCLWATLCPCCSACYMRSKILEGHHERYLCCQGMASKGLDGLACCPVVCMSLESFLCCPCAVGANRAFYAQQHKVRRDPWDNRIARSNNILTYGYCCSGTPVGEEEADEQSRRINASGNDLNCLARMCYLPLLPFMTVQLYLQIRDGPRKNPYEPPQPYDKRAPARLPRSRIHSEDEAEKKRTGKSMRKKQGRKLKAIGKTVDDLETSGDPTMLWWGDEEVPPDAEVSTYVDAAAAARVDGGEVGQKRRRRKLDRMLVTKQPRSNRIHPLHPLAPHVGDKDERKKIMACPTPQRDPAADVREVHTLWSTAMIERAVWAWGEPSDAEDDDVLESERFLSQSGGRSPLKLLHNPTASGHYPQPFASQSHPFAPLGSTPTPPSTGPRGKEPHDVEDYEMMKMLARAKKHGERLMAGEDAPHTAKVEASLNHLEGSAYSSSRRHKADSGHASDASTRGPWKHGRDPAKSSTRGQGTAAVDSDDSIDFANMSHNMPTPWFDSDDSGDDNGGRWGTPPKKKGAPRTQRGRGIGVESVTATLEDPGTRTLTRLSLGPESPHTVPVDPGHVRLSHIEAEEGTPPPWQSQTLAPEGRIGHGSRMVSKSDDREVRSRRTDAKNRSGSEAVPYKRRERQNMTTESKQTILMNSTASFRATTIPTVANAEALSVQSRAVIRGGGGQNHQGDHPVWQEYNAGAPR